MRHDDAQTPHRFRARLIPCTGPPLSTSNGDLLACGGHIDVSPAHLSENMTIWDLTECIADTREPGFLRRAAPVKGFPATSASASCGP